ncbi:MAG: hypothetical protein ABIS20_18090 [Thermoanaerobaculia bacterium]
MKFFITIALAALAIAPAMGGEPRELELPAHVEWCTTVHVPDATQLTTREAQQAVFGDGVKSITNCARANAKRLSRIGTPFLSESTPVEADSKEMRFTFCAAIVPVTDDPPGCEGIAVRQVAEQKVVVGGCPENEATGSCAEKMSTALRGDPWKLDQAAIHALAWRYVQATDALENSRDSFITLLTFGTIHAVSPTDPALAVPEKTLPFGIIAAPLPASPPPTPPATQPGPGRG